MASVGSSGARTFVRQGEVYFVTLDPTIGREQRGHRPVVVLSPQSFNLRTGTPLIAAITTGGEFAKRNGMAVSLSGAGSRTLGVVRCDQIRVLDLSDRNARYVETLNPGIVREILERVAALLIPETT